MGYQNNYKPNYNKDSNFRYNNSNSNKKNNYDNAYIGAPYNFVPFQKKIYSVKDGIVDHNSRDDGLLSGEIMVKVETQSPTLISDGKDRFYRDAYNRMAIPGSSFRGLIRSNVQILGASDVSDDIEDYSLMYRDVANNGLNKKRYDNILGLKTISVNGKTKTILENVKAGYILKKGKDYYIRPPKEDITGVTGNLNYYVVRNRKLVADSLNIDWTIGCFTKEVSYRAKGKNVIEIDQKEKYESKGWLMNSGYMRDKKSFYLIPEENLSEIEDRRITPEDIDSYKIDYENKKNTLRGNASYYALPQGESIKPVFYIESEGRMYFGFTPYLRLFYDHSVKEGITTRFEDGAVDYAKTMFGFSTKESSYKSRVSFSDLVVQSDDITEQEYKFVLGSPKPTAYMNYLRQAGEKGSTYNTDNFELRGSKQYWLYNKEDGIKVNTNASENEKILSTLHAVPEQTVFCGKVRFHNLKKEELGLLLWAIRLESNSWMNIGKGKPYGMGSIKVEVSKVRIFDANKAYSLDEFCLSPYIEAETSEYIDLYKNHLKSVMGINWELNPTISAFFLMKDSTRVPANKNTKYMSLSDFKAQKKGRVSTALKRPEEVAKK